MARLLVASVLVSFLGIVLARYASSECGPGYQDWELFQGHCYKWEGRIGSTYTWHNADKYCRERGAHLASVHSAEENDFIKRRAFHSVHPMVWIGLNAVDGADSFSWRDGSQTDFLNNVTLTDTSRGRCVALDSPSIEKRWLMTHCDNQGSLFCKRSPHETPQTLTPPVTTPNPGNCPESWTRIGNKCFKTFGSNSSHQVNQSTALSLCKAMGKDYDLASIHGTDENSRLTALSGNEQGNLWLGLSRITFTDFGWSDNSALDWTNWAPGEPSSVAEMCVEFQTTKQRAGMWNDISCRTEMGFICQTRPDQSLPTSAPPIEGCATEGFLKYGSSCYRVYSGAEQRQWLDAESTCRGHGGHLASINSAAEMAFLRNTILAQEHQGQLWIGLSTNQRGQFQWSDDWPVTFFNWNKVFRSSAFKCAFLNENGTWSIGQCNNTHGYVCKVSTESPPVWPESDLRPCPTEFPNFLDVGLKHCFALREENVFWWEANFRCLQNDSSLAIFHSQHELDLLSPYISKHAKGLWIGKIRKYHGTFEWVDGSDSDLDIWDKGQPSIKHREDCAQLWPGTMKTRAATCDQWSGFICAISKDYNRGS